MKKKLFVLLSLIIVTLSFCGCGNKNLVTVSINITDTVVSKVVATAENILSAYDSEDNVLYTITIMPAVSDTESTLKTYMNDTAIVYLKIENIEYLRLGIYKNNVALSNGSVMIAPIKYWDYGDSIEFEYELIYIEENVVLSLTGIV